MNESRRFSHRYLKRGPITADSERMRRRLTQGFWDIIGIDRGIPWSSVIRKELGLDVRIYEPGYPDMEQFFRTSELRDILDFITISADKLDGERAAKNRRNEWLAFAERVFREENLNYQVSGDGLVHLLIDEEHQHNRTSAIAALHNHPAALAACQAAFDALDKDPPDTKNAVQSAFETVEILFKRITGAPRLNSRGVKDILVARLQDSAQGNIVEQEALAHLVRGMCGWVDAGHMYRHGQDVEESIAPSVEFTALYLSQGGGYIRRLAELIGT